MIACFRIRTRCPSAGLEIISPFRQTFRLDTRVRSVRKITPNAEHPVIRARRWEEMLKSGAVDSRLALAKKVGLTPGAITLIMKLVDLAPDIQEHLASLKSSSAIWHFGYKPMGKLAGLPFDKQRALFGQMRAEYEQVELPNHARQKNGFAAGCHEACAPRFARSFREVNGRGLGNEFRLKIIPKCVRFSGQNFLT